MQEIKHFCILEETLVENIQKEKNKQRRRRKHRKPNFTKYICIFLKSDLSQSHQPYCVIAECLLDNLKKKVLVVGMMSPSTQWTSWWAKWQVKGSFGMTKLAICQILCMYLISKNIYSFFKASSKKERPPVSTDSRVWVDWLCISNSFDSLLLSLLINPRLCGMLCLWSFLFIWSYNCELHFPCVLSCMKSHRCSSILYHCRAWNSLFPDEGQEWQKTHFYCTCSSLFSMLDAYNRIKMIIIK